MDVRAAIAFEAGEPLGSETDRPEGPRVGEVPVEITDTGICPADKPTPSGAGRPLKLRRHEGYDHGHDLIASFIDDRLDWHHARLRA